MELALRFSTGGEAELEELIDLYAEKLVRYAASILYNHQDAEDVVQDAFIYAFQNRSRFHGKNISAWLYKITYNDCLDKLKAQKRRKWLFFSDTTEEPATYMEDTFSMPEIKEALKRLTPNERALLYGRIVDGLSYEELAQIMQSSPVALRKQYERVKKKAAKYLDECGYGYSVGQREGSRFYDIRP